MMITATDPNLLLRKFISMYFNYSFACKQGLSLGERRHELLEMIVRKHVLVLPLMYTTFTLDYHVWLVLPSSTLINNGYNRIYP